MRLDLVEQLDACNKDIVQQTNHAIRLARQKEELDQNWRRLTEQYNELRLRLNETHETRQVSARWQ